MPQRSSPSRFALIHGITKIVAIAAGLYLSVLCLMSVVGIFTDHGWARVIIAAVVTVVLPLVVADRVLPAHDPASAKGLASDVLALIWLGFPTLFIIAANRVTSNVLAAEGDRLMQAGWPTTAHVTYLLAGVLAVEVPAPAASPNPSAASAGPADATTPASASPSAEAAGSAPASASAEAPPAPTASPPADAGPGDKTPAELFKMLAPSVVSITTKAGAIEGGGTGFLIDRQGTIATNHHVIEDAQAVRVKFMSGDVFDDVELLADDKAHDLALLRVDIAQGDGGASKVSPVDLGDSDAVVVGERAISIGNPLGLEHTLTDGLVSARRTYEGKKWIQMSVPVSPGNSGGPLFNMRGQVIGVTTAQVAAGIFGRAQNLNLAVPINVLKAMISPDYPQRRKFGAGSGSTQW